MPMERTGIRPDREADIRFEGGMGIDAAAPFSGKWNFERAQYPVDRIDLSKMAVAGGDRKAHMPNRWPSAGRHQHMRSKQIHYFGGVGNGKD